MTRTRMIGWVALALFVATIPLANWTLHRYGFVDVPALGEIPAGTAWIAVAFVARDLAQLVLGRWWAVAGIGVGAVLAAWLADPGLAWASLAAFAVSESLDMAVYTANRRRFVVAVAASSVLGALVDSWLFLRIAFGAEAAADGWWRLAVAKVIIIGAMVPVALLVRRRVVVAVPA